MKSKRDKMQRIAVLSLERYRPPSEEYVKREFCSRCPKREPNCFPCKNAITKVTECMELISFWASTMN